MTTRQGNTGNTAGRHSAGSTKRTTRLVGAATALLLTGIAGSRMAAADMAVVRQDATPVVSKPGVGGHIHTRVDSGFLLTVLDRDGEWLRVASPELAFPGDLWVPAGRVGDIVGDMVAAPDAAAPSEPAQPATDRPRFRIASTAAGGMTTLSMAGAPSAGFGSPAGGTATMSMANASSAGLSSATGVSAAGTRLTATFSSGSTTGTSVGVSVSVNAGASAAQAAAQAGDNPTPAIGDPVGSVGDPTPAQDNPTSALGDPVPALGNPVPAAEFVEARADRTPRTRDAFANRRDSAQR